MADPGPLGVYSDAARRMSDALTLAVLAGHTGKWIAIRLSDGGQSGTVYDRGYEAARDQLHPKQCYYHHLGLDGMTPRACEVLLRMARLKYDNHRYDPLAALERQYALEGR